MRLDAVTNGSLFICIKGQHYDSHLDAPAAKQRGAVTLGQCDMPGVMLHCKDTRAAAALLYSAFYAHPARDLSLTGITGTNGKTTTAYLLYQLLNSRGKPSGLIGTLGGYYAGEMHLLGHTTPPPDMLYPLLANMRHHNCQAVVMEASSQAIDQKRLAGLHFSLGVFLNLTRDHLDYHGDMEAYFAAKAKFFDQCRMALVNIDDPYGKRLLQILDSSVTVYTFSAKEKADYRLMMLDSSLEGSSFLLTECKTAKSTTFFLPLIGEMSAWDAAVAVIAARVGYGITFEQAKPILAKMQPVRGRAERIAIDAPFTVLCDYAHTPDALTRLFEQLNAYKGRGRLIGVYGCGGNRDAGKRPLMARAGLKCDVLILTSDNPRGEDPAKILDDMKKGLPETAKCSIIYSRADAIAHALSIAKEGDIVALCGKGHETYQIIGTQKLPMDERTLVQQAWAAWKSDHGNDDCIIRKDIKGECNGENVSSGDPACGKR